MFWGFFPFDSTNLVRDSRGENKKIFGEKWGLEAMKAEIISQVWKLAISSQVISIVRNCGVLMELCMELSLGEQQEVLTSTRLLSSQAMITFLQQHFSLVIYHKSTQRNPPECAMKFYIQTPLQITDMQEELQLNWTINIHRRNGQ